MRHIRIVMAIHKMLETKRAGHIRNAHEYKNYLTQKYECLRSRDYSVNINSSLLSKAMGDEKTKQWLEYNLSLIPKTIEQSRAYVAARGAKILSYSITINGI